MSVISFLAVPLIGAWCALSLWLGRKQCALADAQMKRNQNAAFGDAAAEAA
jgi:hypothetical protein